MSAHSAGAYAATLLVMVNVMKGGGREPPALTSQANFTLMTECTPESRRYYSVNSVHIPPEKPGRGGDVDLLGFTKGHPLQAPIFLCGGPPRNH